MRLRLRDDAPGLLAVERGTPGHWRRRLHAIAMAGVFIAFVFVPSAVANPFCYIPMVCEAKAAIDFVQDPLGFLLQKLTEADVWFLRKMLELIQGTTKIDLTSPGFLKQYAIIFAASSLLTVALWLVAVAKRAVRGVGLVTAVSEAIGFLLLQFVVNAMTPGALALLMKALDEVTAVFEPYATSNFQPFLESVLKVMVAVDPGDSVGVLLVVNLVMLCGALLMWIELLIRSAAIYVAVALGPVVNAGLVDHDLWKKSKKWFGAIFALGLSKPILFALLGLGGAILSDTSGGMSDAVSKILVGALILLLSVFASATVYRWVPAFGDEMASLHHDRKSAQSSGPAAAIDGPAQHANRAMGTHVQDSLVGGSKAAGSTAAGAKTAGARMGGGTAAAGPVAAGLALAKAGASMAKSRATNFPGAQSSDVADSERHESRESQQGGGAADPASAPASARPQGTSSGPMVGSPPDWSAASMHASAGRPPGGTGTRDTPQQPPSSTSPMPSGAPSSTSGTTSGSGPSVTSPPPSRPSGGQAHGRPNPSKDQ
ncbi:hypothetical protein ACWCWD_22620 [Streptomyces sp. NPDC001493]